MPRIVDHSPPDPDPEILAGELAETWANTLRDADWATRLNLMGAIHDQLRADVASLETYCAASPLLVAQLIRQLGNEPVDCLEQAHIYSNSAEERHRRLAGDWLRRHQGSAC